MEEVPGIKETLFLTIASQQAGGELLWLLERAKGRPAWPEEVEFVTFSPEVREMMTTMPIPLLLLAFPVCVHFPLVRNPQRTIFWSLAQPNTKYKGSFQTHLN